MGDRALVVFTNERGERSPVTYLHWLGHEVPDLIQRCRDTMHDRGDDLSYVAARFVTTCAEFASGNTGLGIWNVTDSDEIKSHGDAGLFVVTIGKGDWKAESRDGYGFDREDYSREPQGRTFSVTPR